MISCEEIQKNIYNEIAFGRAVLRTHKSLFNKAVGLCNATSLKKNCCEFSRVYRQSHDFYHV